MKAALKPDWFDQVYHDNYSRVFRYNLKFVDSTKAADIAQEGFLKLLNEFSQKAPPLHLVPWLFQVCRHLCIDELRKGKKMKDDSSFQDDQLEFLAESAEDKIYQDQISDQLAKALKILSFKEQEVVRLKFQEDFSYAQISQVTGHSVDYVGVILHESLKKIKNEVLSFNSKGVQNGKK